jgi:hypothetical protein
MNSPIVGPEQFRLRSSDLASETWIRLHKHYTDRLQKLRADNEADLSPEQTAKLRGQIKEVKAFLALAKPPVPPPTE